MPVESPDFSIDYSSLWTFMFRLSILLALTAVAVALSSTDLKVSVSAIESSVNSVDDIVISAVVSNPTKKDIRIFKKNTILDTDITNSFIVSRETKDNIVTFTGARATYDMSHPALYVTIPAGKSVAVNHTNLGALYDFQSKGTGKFDFRPNTYFQLGSDDAAVQVKAETVSVTVTKDVTRRQLYPTQDDDAKAERLSIINCPNAGRAQVLRDALADARALAGGANSDIGTNPNSWQWNDYFGGNDRNEIRWRLDQIAGDLAASGTRQVYCDRDAANLCGQGVIAYVLLFTSGGNIVGSDVYNCNYFFDSTGNTPDTCRNGWDVTQSSKGGVLLHELSHATSGTGDIAYGCSAARGLSAQDKRNNADNYRCVGLAVYSQYRC